MNVAGPSVSVYRLPKFADLPNSSEITRPDRPGLLLTDAEQVDLTPQSLETWDMEDRGGVRRSLDTRDLPVAPRFLRERCWTPTVDPGPPGSLLDEPELHATEV